MRVLHILTSGIFPMPGGMEASVLRIAKALAEPGHSRVIVYTRRQASEWTAAHPSHGTVEAIHLGLEKAFLMAPLEQRGRATTEGVPSEYLLESLRMDYLLALSAIREKIAAEPGAEHILLSFYLTSNGFIAQQIALALGIPHVASVQGSDFSRDFRSPYHVQSIRFVLENSRLTIANNHEQARILAAAFPGARPIRTIHNALEEDVAGQRWASPAGGENRLAADCEFSFKKGTHVLLRAVAELAAHGERISLTVAGRVAAKEKTYWDECRREYTERYPGVFCFPGWLAPDELRALLLSSAAYVSGTFGEGCSLGQMRAMALGLPIVATRTGALPDLCDGAAHVRLCAPGNARELAAAIGTMLAGMRDGSIAVDARRVDEWRRLFSPETERSDWEAALSAL